MLIHFIWWNSVQLQLSTNPQWSFAVPDKPVQLQLSTTPRWSFTLPDKTAQRQLSTTSHWSFNASDEALFNSSYPRLRSVTWQILVKLRVPNCTNISVQLQLSTTPQWSFIQSHETLFNFSYPRIRNDPLLYLIKLFNSSYPRWLTYPFQVWDSGRRRRVPDSAIWKLLNSSYP